MTVCPTQFRTPSLITPNLAYWRYRATKEDLNAKHHELSHQACTRSSRLHEDVETNLISYRSRICYAWQNWTHPIMYAIQPYTFCIGCLWTSPDIEHPYDIRSFALSSALSFTIAVQAAFSNSVILKQINSQNNHTAPVHTFCGQDTGLFTVSQSSCVTIVSFVTCTLVPRIPLFCSCVAPIALDSVLDRDRVSELKSGRKNGKQARHIPIEGSIMERSIGTHSAYSKSDQSPPLRDQIRIMLTMLVLRSFGPR